MITKYNWGITVVNFVIAIVLITALAFVVFYKLFAVDAHVKAAEVNLQVGKWNKLQVTYAMAYENLGSFRDIGYIPYGKIASDGESSKSRVFSYSSDLRNGKGRFLAVNRVSLNDCLRYEGYWLAYGNPEQIIGNAVVELPVARCAELTPDFELLKDF